MGLEIFWGSKVEKGRGLVSFFFRVLILAYIVKRNF